MDHLTTIGKISLGIGVLLGSLSNTLNRYGGLFLTEDKLPGLRTQSSTPATAMPVPWLARAVKPALPAYVYDLPATVPGDGDWPVRAVCSEPGSVRVSCAADASCCNSRSAWLLVLSDA